MVEARRKCRSISAAGAAGALVLSLACADAGGSSLPIADAPAEDALAGDLRRHVEYLASDELGGRETGEIGVARAEDYIAAAFESYGLAPLPGRDDYFAPFTLYRRAFDVEATSVTITAGGETHLGEPGTDFRVFSFSDMGTREAEVVFAGYGITAPEYDYDDYAGLDVGGKLVFVLRHEPRENDPASPFDGTRTTAHSTFAAKAQNARSHGAAGMILVTDPLHTEAEDLRLGDPLQLDPSERQRRPARDSGFVAVHVSRRLGEVLAQSRGASLAALHRALDEGAPASTLALRGVRAHVRLASHQAPEEIAARNVVAFLEGADPQLRDEWIVVGAHHDHEGRFAGAGDSVFNGADDNASGTAGVLAVARELAGRRERLGRSVVFATFSAEEKGLLGSRSIVREDVLSPDRVVFMLNLDMIGRNPDQAVRIIGDGYVKGLRELVEAENAAVELALRFAGTDYAGNSDHHPFYRRGVPFAFVSTGTHEDYHRPSDHADKIEYARMARIIGLAAGVVEELATRPAALTFIHHVAWLGLRVEVEQRDGRREAVVTGVEDDSQAADVGFEKGDVLVAVGDDTLEDPDRVGSAFRSIDPGETRRITLRRGDDARRLTVERAEPGYLGIVPAAWDPDARRRLGLPGSGGVVITGLAEGGPADKAGLAVGDVLLSLAGEPISVDGLRRRLARIGAGETVEVSILRDGERKVLSVALGTRPR